MGIGSTSWGASGDLTCLETAAGKRVWSVNVLREFGGSNPRWGLSESPLVVGQRVLVNAGGPGASMVAFDKQSGKVIWKSESDGAGYSSAVVQRVGNTQQAVFFTATRAVGVDINDGHLLWGYPRVANRVANIATPIVKDNFVFLSSDYGTGAALLKLDAAAGGVTATEVYFTQEMRNHHSSSILVGDHLYGFSSAILTALRFADGVTAWKDRSVGKGSIAFADGHLYLFSENGVVGLAEATPTGVRRERPFQHPAGRPADMGAPDHLGRTPVYPGPGHDLRVQREEVGAHGMRPARVQPDGGDLSRHPAEPWRGARGAPLRRLTQPFVNQLNPTNLLNPINPYLRCAIVASMREVDRIVDLLQRAHAGDAWHGPSVVAVLDGVDAAAARARPIAAGHTIWETALHIVAWRREVEQRLGGKAPTLPEHGDWPVVPSDDGEWAQVIEDLHASNRSLVAAVKRLVDADLERPVGEGREAGLGSGVSVAVMLHGIVAHDVYHAGQIALLKK